jgi:hydrocephalus-inducing protein
LCTIAGKNTYELNVSGHGVRPALLFSFYQYNFGPCFVPMRGAVPRPERAILRIANNEIENDIAFDCLFERKPWMDVQCEPTILRPNESVDVPILFTPRELRSYKEVIPFEVNGVSTLNVLVSGEGETMKVELANPSQSEINFGSLRVGQESMRRVKVVNRSKRAATLELAQHVEAGQGRLESRAISYLPVREVKLAPRESMFVELRFSPMSRITPFHEELLVRLEGADNPRHLLTVTGACQGIEVRLETEAMTFGSVCECCVVTRGLQLSNTGDIGTKFRWDAAAFMPDFSVFPTEGFLAPHSDVKLDVSFHPTRVHDDFRAEKVVCFVDGSEPLMLTLSGACVPQPESGTHSLDFEARVRQTSSQTVTIENPTSEEWHLQPAHQHEFWTGKKTLEVPPMGEASYDIIFQPLSMTQPTAEVRAAMVGGGESGYQFRETHQGSVFFALPNGQGILYRVNGVASEPELAGKIEKKTPAKEGLVIALPVQNWLKQAQRFHVSIEREVPGPSGDAVNVEPVKGKKGKAVAAVVTEPTSDVIEPSHFLRGADCVDVPALNSRDYKLNFLGYKEGVSQAAVRFTNLGTGEFVLYKVRIMVTAPGIQDSITLETPVRQSVQHLITLENPLSRDQPVTFEEGNWWHCDDRGVRVRQLGDMAGQAEGTFEVEFRPISMDSVLGKTESDAPSKKGKSAAPAGKGAKGAAAKGKKSTAALVAPAVTAPGISEYEVPLTITCLELGEYRYNLKLRVRPAGMNSSLTFKVALGGEAVQTFRFMNYVQGDDECPYNCGVGQPDFFSVVPVVKASPGVCCAPVF